MSTTRSISNWMHTGTGTQFLLNISPIAFDDAEVRVGVLPYEGGDQLALPRTDRWVTHVFQRVECTPEFDLRGWYVRLNEVTATSTENALQTQIR